MNPCEGKTRWSLTGQRGIRNLELAYCPPRLPQFLTQPLEQSLYFLLGYFRLFAKEVDLQFAGFPEIDESIAATLSLFDIRAWKGDRVFVLF